MASRAFHCAKEAPVRDRLLTMLFLAALLHGLIILGLTFNSAARRQRGAPGLKVLLVSDEVRRRNATTRRPTSHSGRSSAPVTPESVAPRNPHRPYRYRSRRVPRAATPSRPRAATCRSAGGPRPHHHRLESAGPLPGRRRATPAISQESAPAAGAAEFRPARSRGRKWTGDAARPEARRALGDPGYPGRHARALPGCLAPQGGAHRHHQLPDARRGSRQKKANPVIEVGIAADGTLDKLSSAHPAAIRSSTMRRSQILKLASPFDPFPPELARTSIACCVLPTNGSSSAAG